MAVASYQRFEIPGWDAAIRIFPIVRFFTQSVGPEAAAAFLHYFFKTLISNPCLHPAFGTNIEMVVSYDRWFLVDFCDDLNWV